MNNGEQSAYPIHGGYQNDDPRNQIIGGGLTKREYFAAMAMQSMATVVFSGYNEAYHRQLLDWQGKYGDDVRVREAIAKDAIELADELLKQLNK